MKKDAYKKLKSILDRHIRGQFDIRRIWLEILYRTNNYEGIIKYINIINGKREARGKDDVAECFCWKAVAHFLLKDYASARDSFKKVEENQQCPELKYFLAKCFLELLDLDKAEVYYRNLIHNDLVSEGYYGYACCMIERKRFDEALAFINKALSFGCSKNSVEMLNKKGLCLMQKGFFKEALSCFDQCLELSPKTRHVKANAALALSKLGRHQNAGEYYKELLNKFPYDIITINNLALCLSLQGEYKSALNYCNKGLAIDPLNADLLANKGCVLFYLGEYNNALKCMCEAEKTLNDDANLQNNKALCLMRMHECQGAQEIFDNLISKGHYSVDVLLNRAYCLIKCDRYDEALRCLAEIDSADNRLYDIYSLHSICFEKMGNDVKAAEYFNKAIKYAG